MLQLSLELELKQLNQVLQYCFSCTYLLISYKTPTLSHVSGFAIYTDVWDKGPSNAQRFVFCLSSPHHSLMTLADMALTVFIFFSSTPPISCCTKSCETKTHQSHHYTTFICTEPPFSSISLFKRSKSFCGWILSHYFSFLSPIADYFCNCPPPPSPLLNFFWAKYYCV